MSNNTKALLYATAFVAGLLIATVAGDVIGYDAPQKQCSKHIERRTISATVITTCTREMFDPYRCEQWQTQTIPEQTVDVEVGDVSKGK